MSPRSEEYKKRKRSPTYHTWNAMIQRCTNPNSPNYPNWGGRGINVCESWRDYKTFLSDMGERPYGKTLDRIDVNKDYSPENCRWATYSEQRINQRCMQPILAEHTKVFEEHDKICEELGINI